MVPRRVLYQFLSLLVFLRLLWSLRRHYARICDPRFSFPRGQTLILRTLIDVCLSFLVATGETVYGITNPKVIARIARSYIYPRTLRGALYGPHAFNVADVFFPASASSQVSRRPVVVFVRGGAWSWGSRAAYGSFCQAVSNATDSAVVNADYRVYPHGNVCDMTCDIISCLAWAIGSADNWGCDGRRVHLLGHSAGAHLVMHVAVTLAQAAAAEHDEGLPPHSCSVPQGLPVSTPDVLASLRSCMGIAGVYHIASHFDHEASRSLTIGPVTVLRGLAHVSPMHPAMCGPHFFDAHSPTTAVARLSTSQAAEMPSIFLLHGSCDAVVPVTSSQRLHSACLRAGVRSSLRVVPGMDHATALVDVMGGNTSTQGGLGHCVLVAASSAVAEHSSGYESRGMTASPHGLQ